MYKKIFLSAILALVSMFTYMQSAKAEIDVVDMELYNKLKGKIILQVESRGEAYYVSPVNKKMYFLSRPEVAFEVMRGQGIGIKNSDLQKIPVADSYCPNYNIYCDKTNAHNLAFANSQKGKIFLQIEENGEAWYVNPIDAKRYYLGRPSDAFSVMRKMGLGITDWDFGKLNGLTNFSIKELGIVLQINNSLAKELVYHYDKESVAVSFSTKTFAEGDSRCSAEEGPLGKIYTNDTIEQRKIAEIDGKAYYFSSPQSPCSFKNGEVNTELYTLAAMNAGGSYQLGTWNETAKKWNFAKIIKNK